jgi:competence protein ComEC
LPISQRREGSVVFNKLIDFKNHCVKIIDQNLHEPQSSLLAGIIFGQKRSFSEEFENNTRISGVSHIVAASGYNITILVLAVNKLFFFIRKKPRILLSICVLWCFCIISGLSSSIIRASIMSTIALIAIMLGRDNSIHISLPLASFIFVIINPVIIFDVGFQLSILATMGLIYLSPSLEILLQKIAKKELKGVVKEYVLTTLSCTLVTLPISISTFQTFSIWSVLANTLILPIVESTMLWGVLGVTVNILSPVIGKFFFLITYVQLKYFELVVSGIGSFNCGYWEVEEGSSFFLAFLISILILTISIYFYPINNEGTNHYLKIS